MEFLAVTGATASWVIGKPSLIGALHDLVIVADDAIRFDLDFVEGPFRISSVTSGISVIAFWNTDYLSGTGDEAWGFIKLNEEDGIRSNPGTTREVFERCLYIISQRLQGLTIDGSLFPRPYESGAHTCLAGRGSEARHLSVGYFERQIGADELWQQAIVCVGPEQNFRQLDRFATNAGAVLGELVASANKLILPGRKVQVGNEDYLSSIRPALNSFTKSGSNDAFENVEVVFDDRHIEEKNKYTTTGNCYRDWILSSSPLSPIQRRILFSDSIEQHPIRIVGPAGSGKTLLMQLLAIRQVQKAADKNAIKVLYIVHNQAMAQMVKQRFEVLLCNVEVPAVPEVKTLSLVARELLELADAYVIDVDAFEAKEFQLSEIKKALNAEMESRPEFVSTSMLLSNVAKKVEVFDIFCKLVMSDISIAIKGHGLQREKLRYVQSAKNLSMFHGVLDSAHREFVFSVFQRYHKNVFEDFEVLDSDDLAISLLGRLRTPIWDLRRRQLGYDFIFVDETQLFNENERRVIPLLTNGKYKHIPVALAMDEAQATYGQSAAGFATLGIEGITNETLGSIHRSTKSIVDLAFFVIQRSTDLFGPDFPNFKDILDRLEPQDHPLAAKPCIEQSTEAKQDFGKFILRRVRELRKSNIRQISIIVHADQYWDAIVAQLEASDLPLQLLLTRGQKLSADQPLVVLTKPAFVGGQEFDAAILVGLEQGIVPPRIIDNEALNSAVEQQSIREIYLSITRARYRVVVALAHSAVVTSLLEGAEATGLIVRN